MDSITCLWLYFTVCVNIKSLKKIQLSVYERKQFNILRNNQLSQSLKALFVNSVALIHRESHISKCHLMQSSQKWVFKYADLTIDVMIIFYHIVLLKKGQILTHWCWNRNKNNHSYNISIRFIMFYCLWLVVL